MMGRAFGFERPLAGGTKPGWWSPWAALQACRHSVHVLKLLALGEGHGEATG